MSEQQAERIDSENGSLDAQSAVTDDASSEKSKTSEPMARDVDAPKTTPDLAPDVPRTEATKSEADPVEAARPSSSIPTGAAATGPARPPAELLILPSGRRGWKRRADDGEGHPGREPADEKPARGRRLAAVAAMLMMATIAGAAGGAFATISLSRLTEAATAPTPNLAALDASVGRIDADLAALKAGLEPAASASLAKTNDRLARIESTQAESAAKLAKLVEAVDKLRVAAAAAPAAAAAAKEATGAVTTPAGAQPLPQLHAPATTAAAVTEVGRLPTVEGWVLRDAGRGSAVIEGRNGIYEVFAGDPVPGLGRVQAIRKQDGRWVVVTQKGLIVAR